MAPHPLGLGDLAVLANRAVASLCPSSSAWHRHPHLPIGDGGETGHTLAGHAPWEGSLARRTVTNSRPRLRASAQWRWPGPASAARYVAGASIDGAEGKQRAALRVGNARQPRYVERLIPS